jgi:nitroreductase
MEFLSKLNWRYAVKGFDATKKIPADQLENLLEALRLAPSSYGLQPWKFVVVENVELREKLKAASWGQGQTTDASHLLVLCRKESVDQAEIDRFIQTTASERGQELTELDAYKKMMEGGILSMDAARQEVWASKQVYLALGVLLSACASADIDACPMEGFDSAQYDQILDLPGKGLRSVVVCAVGYRSADDKYAMAKKVRYPKDEVIVRL